MNPNVIANIASVVAIAAILAGTYGAFFALAAQMPAGRTLGVLGAAMMAGSGLAWAGVSYLASRCRAERLRLSPGALVTAVQPDAMNTGCGYPKRT
jgi:hypothetical protein